MSQTPMQQHMIERLKEIAEENPNGFTVHLPTLQPVVKGWIVAKAETQNSFGDEGLKTAYEVAIKTSKILGGWYEDGKWYWDASDVYYDENEATKAGIANEQIAIYNIETATLKFL